MGDLSDPILVTLIVAGFFLLLLLITTLRLLLRRDSPRARWQRLRVGIFVERDHGDEEDDERVPPA